MDRALRIFLMLICVSFTVTPAFSSPVTTPNPAIKLGHQELFQSYRRNCDAGSLEGCVNLGILYENGEGVKQSYDEAEKLYRKACDAGLAQACKTLVFSYKNGKGIKLSRDEAEKLYQKAFSSDDAQCCNKLGIFCEETHCAQVVDDAEDPKLNQKFCNAGEADSCYLIGAQYETSHRVKKSYTNAIFFYKKACNLGSERGCSNLTRLQKK